MKRALISVSDKRGAAEFAGSLAALGYEIVSTGGTLAAVREAGVAAKSVSDITGFPECLGGRVKTLHPMLHGGILAVRSSASHMDELVALGIGTIDIVAVNLYPFKETILRPGAPLAEAVENIDIGGPSMIRAAAKNYAGVAVVCDPDDYGAVIRELSEDGGISHRTRFRLAAKAFAYTAAYDALIADYLGKRADTPPFGGTLTLTYEKRQPLRYGENPHQSAAFYAETGAGAGTLAAAEFLHGKELSFNNISDLNGALALVREFAEPTAVAVKHGNPCGVGSAGTIRAAYLKAYAADTVSIFGGIIALNRPVDAATAAEIHKIFVEIVCAPDFSEDALAILRQKKNIRLLRLPGMSERPAGYDMRKVSGGLLVQEPDDADLDPSALAVVTRRAPTDSETADLRFAWKIVKHVRSNAIAIAKGGQSVGIGAGQVNRVWAAKQAVEHAAEFLGADALRGAALASDAFFPFPDSVEAAAAAGVSAIIHPGGSRNDQASIDVCDANGIAMVVTGIRHFKH
ncbi:MAG: bifunctional phosphoribosylaminoimidazolecarboxamide formyltransferase/IMP cyclohydrolase [Clostridiales bacterium]|jgi:phosphoribosylaminoimidazolecarboxamide formyltransferase/IMP cyclohydrolase|nr:bifunctional phosphoribosylaminoimidazolecarboxamide formyltransferase/IMP cyclohydrolase [Clostridiales bacterium]